MPAPPVPAAEAARQRAQRRRLRRRITAIIFAVPLLLLAGALYLYFGPKPPPPPQTFPVTPQRAAQATQNVDAIREALTGPPSPSSPPAPSADSVKPASAPSGTARPTPAVRHVRGPQDEDLVTMQLSQADLNAYLSGNPQVKAALERKGVHGVSVELQAPDVIIFHANATLRGLVGNALVSAALVPDPQTAVQLDITDARFGRLPPLAVKAAAREICRQVLARPHSPLPISVRKVEVKGTDLVVTGVQTK